MKSRSSWVLIKHDFEQSNTVVTDSKLVPSCRVLNSRHAPLNSTTEKVRIHESQTYFVVQHSPICFGLFGYLEGYHLLL